MTEPTKVEPKLDLSKLTSEQITQALSKLSPSQLVAVRQAALQSGLTQESDKFRRLSDGSIEMVVRIDRDRAEPILSFASLAQESPYDYIHNILLQGLDGWMLGPAEEEGPAPAPAATTKIPLGTPATTTT